MSDSNEQPDSVKTSASPHCYRDVDGRLLVRISQARGLIIRKAAAGGQVGKKSMQEQFSLSKGRLRQLARRGDVADRAEVICALQTALEILSR